MRGITVSNLATIF